MGKLFGTDGIRGVANRPPMTPEMALAVGRAIASYFKNNESDTIVIGQDTRISGDMLKCALAAGFNASGVDACLVGVMPTPGVAKITERLGACAGVVISASHNPYEDNGIKIFDGKGWKLSESVEESVEKLVFDQLNLDAYSTFSRSVGQCKVIADAGRCYADFLISTVSGMSLQGVRLVLDCSHGATFQVAPDIFSRLGADVSVLSDKPDGVNINLNCGSQHPEILKQIVLENKAHAGFAFDGDGDRVIAVDETGTVLTGDQAMTICALNLKQNGRLVNNRVIGTVMSNMGLKIALNKHDIQLFLSQVGDRHVMEMMKAEGAVLGGEDSGHTIFLDRHTTGDGILTALQILEAMQTASKPLSALAATMTVYPQVLINIPVCDQPDIGMIPEIQNVVRQVETGLGNEGRVLIRYSGTQPLCRIMVEGPSHDDARSGAEKIAEAVHQTIGQIA